MTTVAVKQLFFSQGRSDKFYKAVIRHYDTPNNHYQVAFSWGRRGGTGSANYTSYDTWDQALAAANNKLTEKHSKGYTANNDGVTPCSHVEAMITNAQVLPGATNGNFSQALNAVNFQMANPGMNNGAQFAAAKKKAAKKSAGRGNRPGQAPRNAPKPEPPARALPTRGRRRMKRKKNG